jgi:hypothetical protein
MCVCVFVTLFKLANPISLELSIRGAYVLCIQIVYINIKKFLDIKNLIC